MDRPPVRDEIVFRDMVLPCRVGVLPGESDAPQDLRVRLRVRVDLGPAGHSDQLRDTVDYGALARAVAEALSEGRYALLEAVAAKVARVALSAPAVERVDVEVEKMHPPLPEVFGPVGVRIQRHRGETR